MRILTSRRSASILAGVTLIFGMALVPPVTTSASSEQERFVSALTGDAARSFVTRVAQTDRKFVAAQQRSAVRLAARGYHPTDTVVVHLVRQRKYAAPASLAHQLAEYLVPTLSAQIVTDEGYAILTSWDDGDSGTWEGNLYLVDYHEQLNTSIDNQIDISNAQPPPVNWAQGDMQGGGGDEIIYISSESAKAILGFQRVSTSAAGTADALSETFMAPRCGCGLGQYLARCFVRSAFDDAWPYCVGLGGGCLFAGPAWFQCAAGSCTGSFASFAIIHARETLRDCRGG